MLDVLMSQATPEGLMNLSQLGVAGLMGGLWWWERRYARQREEELSTAHKRIVEQKESLTILLDALQQNTAAISTFTAVQQELVSLLRQQTSQAVSGT